MASTAGITSKIGKVLILAALIAPLLVIASRQGPARASGCVPPPAGLTGWWPGDGNTDDIIGGRSGVLNNGATFGSGIVADAFALDGADDYVDVAHDVALNAGTGDFTVDLWVWFNSTSGEQILVEKYIEDFTPNPIGWTLTKLGNNVIGFFSGPGAATASPNLQSNTWIHIAARRSSGVATVFVNGVPGAPGTFTVDVDSTSSFKFGHRGNPSNTPGSLDGRGFYLNGRIDEVEYFVGTALTDAQILAIYEAGPDGKCKTPPDSTPPIIGPCPAAGPFLLNTGPQSVGPVFADDADSGLDISASTLTGSVDTSGVGLVTVTFTAVDNAGLSSSLDCEYTVGYQFEGFLPPVDNDMTNDVRAGRSIPVKWRLTDGLGQPVDDPDSFVSLTSQATPSACGGGADAVEETAGASGLQSLGDGYWQFNWATPKAYSGQCRTMLLRLSDGATDRTAEFSFK